MATISARTCEIMQYMEYMTEKTIQEISQNIEKLTQIKTYCIILHDKDKNDDGTLKAPHFHAVITLKSQMTFDSIAKTINVPVNYVNKIKTTTKYAQEYLIHLNHPNKYQYDVTEVVANFDYSKIIKYGKEGYKLDEIAEKIESGEIKQYNLYQYVTIEMYSKYKTNINRMFEYRQQKIQNGDRHMECIFITGAAGTGKTSYAKIIAKSMGCNTYVSAGGKNPLDDYAGQECIILDDTRDSTFSMTDFLKLTDNHTDSLVGCRYYNKSIAECRYLIVTSVKPIELFYKTAIEQDKEPQAQLFRRFSSIIQVTEKYLTFYVYDEDQQKFINVNKSINPITYGKQQMQKRKNLTEQIIKSTNVDTVENSRVGKPMLEEMEMDDYEIPFKAKNR